MRIDSTILSLSSCSGVRRLLKVRARARGAENVEGSTHLGASFTKDAHAGCERAGVEVNACGILRPVELCWLMTAPYLK